MELQVYGTVEVTEFGRVRPIPRVALPL